jgi:ethanolamine transporter EutH
MNPYVRHFFVGIVIGVVVPMTAFYVFYCANYTHIPFAAYVKMLSMRSMLSKVLSISAIPNLLCFYICLWADRENMARGILGGTVLTAIAVATLYFVY